MPSRRREEGKVARRSQSSSEIPVARGRNESGAVGLARTRRPPRGGVTGTGHTPYPRTPCRAGATRKETPPFHSIHAGELGTRFLL
jgi:hypothetical protein